ncbi:MAG: SAM-dependent methyltransferase, partial [Actinomycetota bacterium]|nr:SAM-dependent methyltransferase [Actinomycetota bacterium]
PLRFDEFMSMALYGPGGYYTTRVPGEFDYDTAPSGSEWFGKLAAVQIEGFWELLGRPDDFRIVEIGPGRGDLAAAAAGALKAPLREAVTWHLVEPLPYIEMLQRHRLSEAQARFEWMSNLRGLESSTGVLLANEVLDNFAFRVFEVTEEGVEEIGVGIRKSRPELEEVRLELEEPYPEEVLLALDHVEPGDRFEVREFDNFCNDAAHVLDAGFLLVIDYGDVEPDIWVRRPMGTVVTYSGARLAFDPLEGIGMRDITAHVNFSSLERSARRAGMKPTPLRTQREWLASLGLNEAVTALRDEARSAADRGLHGEWLRLVLERSRIASLASEAGLGAHKVFLAATDRALQPRASGEKPTPGSN